MTYILDTDVVADWLRGKPETVAQLSPLSHVGLGISLVTYGEIYKGIYFGRDPQKSETVFIQFLRAVDVLPLGREIMKRFARIRGDLRRQGRLIGDPDILSTATALHHDLTLMSGNRSHVERIPNLKLHSSQEAE